MGNNLLSFLQQLLLLQLWMHPQLIPFERHHCPGGGGDGGAHGGGLCNRRRGDYIEMLVETESSFGCKTHGSSDDCSEVVENWLKCARLDAILWILKTREFFGFRFQTAFLSITYFDRFLSNRAMDSGKPWAISLLSVACLTLAAKMEECRVPALSEFRMEEHNFETKVIRRMEFLVLNTLEWEDDDARISSSRSGLIRNHVQSVPDSTLSHSQVFAAGGLVQFLENGPV